MFKPKIIFEHLNINYFNINTKNDILYNHRLQKAIDQRASKLIRSLLLLSHPFLSLSYFFPLRKRFARAVVLSLSQPAI